MATIVKVWRQVENPTVSINVYVKNNPAKFYPVPILNHWALNAFLKRSPQQEEQDE